VPNDTIWRFGADFATHISTTKDLRVGDTVLPAGRYTLWMWPSDSGTMLVVNSRVNIFGTGYNKTADIARIPMTREHLPATVEKFTIDITGGRLRALWDQTAWSVRMESAR
jgi:hypothetical protein